MTTWEIWNQRNHVRLHKPCCASDQIATQAKERFQEFRAVLPPKPPRTTRTKDIWKPPDAGHFKINFDGAIFRNENRCGIGVVIRDHTGFVIASLVQSISRAYQPIEVEALAAARALEFGQEIRIGGAVLEGDLELIINFLKAGGNTIASVEPLIQDVILFSNSYSELLYSCRREGNSLAHSLATYSSNVSNHVVWMEEVSNHLLSVFQQDLANLTNQFQ